MKKNLYGRCQFPGCDGNIVPGKSVANLCIRHSEMLRFLVWAIKNITVTKEPKTDSGIIIPSREEVLANIKKEVK
jgi:hypothetical protein